jgi:hypothetical protein
MAAEMARALGSLLRGGWLLITLMIGSDAVCSDGYRGEVRAAVIDPVARTLTHIVVEPKGRVGLARLVPLGLVEAAPDEAAPHEAASDQVRLRCTEAEFMSLDPAEETLAEFVPGYPDPVQLLPPGWRGAGGATVEGGTILRIPEHETIDVIPAGEVEERGDQVHATDGDIGHLHALRVDPADGRITQVLVRRGPVWNRSDAAIPFDQVTGFDDGIRLSLTRQQVKDLPPAAL